MVYDWFSIRLHLKNTFPILIKYSINICYKKLCPKYYRSSNCIEMHTTIGSLAVSTLLYCPFHNGHCVPCIDLPVCVSRAGGRSPGVSAWRDGQRLVRMLLGPAPRPKRGESATQGSGGTLSFLIILYWRKLYINFEWNAWVST